MAPAHPNRRTTVRWTIGWALITLGGRLLGAPHLSRWCFEQWVPCSACRRWEPSLDCTFHPDHLAIVCADCEPTP